MELIKINQQKTVSEIKQSVKAQMLSGDIDVLYGNIFLKKLNKATEELLKDEDIRAAVAPEVEKLIAGTEKGKSATIYGATLQMAPTYTIYDFAVCNHPEWNELNSLINKLNERKKVIEQELMIVQKEAENLYKNSIKDGEVSIKSPDKKIIVEYSYHLDIIESDEVVLVSPPKKIQSIGVRYSKL